MSDRRIRKRIQMVLTTAARPGKRHGSSRWCLALAASRRQVGLDLANVERRKYPQRCSNSYCASSNYSRQNLREQRSYV